ncbi:hypothetical protein S83_004535, partial [Arachis hypogaea]
SSLLEPQKWREIQNPMSHAIECARSLHLPPKSCECVELVYQVGICGEHGRSHLLLHSLLKLVLTMSHTLLLGRKLIGRLLKIFSYHGTL